MQRNDPRIRLTREWLGKAEDDLRVAELAFTASVPIPWATAFHCQQASEKVLKGYLAWQGQPLSRTHDLRDLVQQCGALDPQLLTLRQAAETLHVFAVDPRYPGTGAVVTLEQAQEALLLAQEIARFVLDRLPSEAQPSC